MYDIILMQINKKKIILINEFFYVESESKSAIFVGFQFKSYKENTLEKKVLPFRVLVSAKCQTFITTMGVPWETGLGTARLGEFS